MDKRDLHFQHVARVGVPDDGPAPRPGPAPHPDAKRLPLLATSFIDATTSSMCGAQVFRFCTSFSRKPFVERPCAHSPLRSSANWPALQRYARFVWLAINGYPFGVASAAGTVGVSWESNYVYSIVLIVYTLISSIMINTDDSIPK
jgi:hypothetical protein